MITSSVIIGDHRWSTVVIGDHWRSSVIGEQRAPLSVEQRRVSMQHLQIPASVDYPLDFLLLLCGWILDNYMLIYFSNTSICY